MYFCICQGRQSKNTLKEENKGNVTASSPNAGLTSQVESDPLTFKESSLLEDYLVFDNLLGEQSADVSTV